MLKAIYLFNHGNCSHPPLDAVYMFLPQKEWQCTSVMCRFHSFYHLLSLAVTHCDLLPFVVIRCHSLYHSLSLVVIRCTTRCHSLSQTVQLAVTPCTTRVSFYKRSRNLMVVNREKRANWKKIADGEKMFLKLFLPIN